MRLLALGQHQQEVVLSCSKGSGTLHDEALCGTRRKRPRMGACGHPGVLHVRHVNRTLHLWCHRRDVCCPRPWVPAPVRAERCLARSGTIDEADQKRAEAESLITANARVLSVHSHRTWESWNRSARGLSTSQHFCDRSSRVPEARSKMNSSEGLRSQLMS